MIFNIKQNKETVFAANNEVKQKSRRKFICNGTGSLPEQEFKATD